MIKEKAVFPMMLHTEVINYIATKIDAKSYLEIGVFNPGHNFDRIKCLYKLGIDPDPTVKADIKMTSDEFFQQLINGEVNYMDSYMKLGQVFDIIYIDGLHHADQVRKDLINAWKCLNPLGVCIIHDTNPPTEQTTCIPRGSQREWCGTVYKAIFQINEPEKFTIKDDYGITVIRKTGELKMNNGITNWEEFDMFRDEILNLKTWEEGIKIIDSWK